MLTSSFMENSNTASGERKVYEVVVEEADFVTMYWLLKYCYANWVLFKDHDNPHASVNRTGKGWSVKWLSKWSGVALLKHTSYLIGSDGVSALTKLSKQDSNATVQSNGELPLAASLLALVQFPSITMVI
ncbi:hypothetical protein BU17DRAFT_70689 [Hysterangium stoloniferum]|nr:hypothetical protein BU17DRAFT_70689 [Hysterangium stoloniferum]